MKTIKLAILLLGTASILACNIKNKEVAESTVSTEKTNSLIAKQALTELFDTQDLNMLDKFIGNNLIQHSANIKDGKGGIQQNLEMLKNNNIISRRDIVRVIAEFDLALVQSRLTLDDKSPVIVGNLFRLENGKIIEQWEVMQNETPKEKSANGNSMIDGLGNVHMKLSASELKRNKDTVMDFIHEGFAKGDKETLGNLFGSEYIQHNPRLPNGKNAVLRFIPTQGQGFPAKIKQIIAQGDLVAALVEYGIAGTNFHNIAIDIFRLDGNGKVVEHWDIVNKVPKASDLAHSNGAF